MNRRVLHLSAMLATVAVSTLAAAPAFAATTVSQASAQSLILTVAGQNAVTQSITATNDGTTETKTNSDTVPKVTDLIPGNSLLTAGAAPQDAGANADGTSYACAGLAGTASSGVVTTNHKACNINGSPLDLKLATLNLGNAVITDAGALGTALNAIPLVGGSGGLLETLGVTAGALSTQIANALATTPLGQVSLGGSISVVEATCTANPDAAQGATHIADAGGAATIGVTLPGGVNVPLANLPANPPPNTKVLTDISTVTASVINALKTQLSTTVTAPLTGIIPVGPALDAVKAQVVDTLIAQIKDPLLVPLEQNVADITLNKQVVSDGGKKIQVTALDAQVLPAAAAATGSSLLSGEVGKVTCGPNARVVATPSPSPSPTPTPTPTPTPEVPTVVDSGLAAQNGTTRTVLAATAALMLLAGSAGLIGYRRMLAK